MDTLLNLVLPVLLYVFGIILLIVLTVFFIRLMFTLQKVDKVVDDVSDKVDSLDGLFKIIDATTDGISLFSETIVGTVSKFFYKVLKPRKKHKKEEDTYE